MKAIEIQCKTIVNRMQDGFFAMRYLPFRLTANIYRGCFHGCIYCYAARSHFFVGSHPNLFSKEIFVKINADTMLDKTLRKYNEKSLKNILIIGNVSDTYQPLEMKYHLTRKCLEICLKHEYPCYIETKSPLIMKDVDVIEKLSNKGLINIGMTLTSYAEDFTKFVEPMVASSKRRIKTLGELSSIGVETCLHITPYFPIITNKDLEKMIRDASRLNINYVICAPLEMSSYIQGQLFSKLGESRDYSFLIAEYKRLYREEGRKFGARITTSYEFHYGLEKMIRSLCDKYNIGYWSFTNPQFHSARIGNAYRWRYPTVHDYWSVIKEKGEICLSDATQLAKGFNVDNKYLKSLERYWKNGELFKGITGVIREKNDSGIVYCLVNDLDLGCE